MNDSNDTDLVDSPLASTDWSGFLNDAWDCISLDFEFIFRLFDLGAVVIVLETREELAPTFIVVAVELFPLPNPNLLS